MKELFGKLTERILAGKSGWGNRPADEILGKPASEARAEDLEEMSLREILLFFHALPAPGTDRLSGEYVARVLAVGLFHPLAGFITHHVFGPGRWLGKGFAPASTGESHGYNIFEGPGGKLCRTRRMRTEVRASAFDGRPSFCLDYSPYNRFFIGTMRDEIRQVNEKLYLGFGYMLAGGGAANPAPFVLAGKARPFVGADA